MKKIFGFLILIIGFTQINASAQTIYLNKEVLFYEDDDSLNAETTTRQIFDTLGRLVFEENVGWSKTWFTYKDQYLVSSLCVEPSDSMDNLAEKTFPHFYNDTTLRFHKNTFNKNGQLIYRLDSIWKFSAKKPAGCVRYDGEEFDYTRVWREYTDSKAMEYDCKGRLISESSSDEKRSWKYDSLGRLIEKFEHGRTQLIQYNPSGRVEMYIFNYSDKPDTIQTSFSFKKEFDKQGRLIKEIEFGKALDREHTITLMYDYKEDELYEKKIENRTYRDHTSIKTYITISKNKSVLAPIK